MSEITVLGIFALIINTAVIPLPVSTQWIDALQRKADEDTSVLHKLTSDWQNYSRVLSAIKSNTSSTMQTIRFLQNNIVADHQRMAISTELYYDLTHQVSAFVSLIVLRYS